MSALRSLLLFANMVCTLSLQPHEKRSAQNFVKEMFLHSYENYIVHAFPRDELRPLSCEGVNTLGGINRGYALTLIDNLDALILFQQFVELRKAVLWVIYHWSPDIDENVSIFETNIRILGGLLSTHIFLSNDISLWLTLHQYEVDELSDDVYLSRDTLQFCFDDDLHRESTHSEQYDDANIDDLICLQCDPFSIYFFECYYNGELLDLAIDLAERLLPAFAVSKTGIPFGTVNLRHGVPEKETTIVCTACAGTFLLEFGVLSLLTDRWNDFYAMAKRAAVKLFHARNADTNLIGKHINNLNGIWTQMDCSLGTFIDSYLEYLLKAYFVFSDDDLLLMFNELWSAMWYHLNHKWGYNSKWYTEVRVQDGQQLNLDHDTFSSFWPGLLALNGNLRMAQQFLDAMIHRIVNEYNFIPEKFDLHKMRPLKRYKQYFLRPEFVESLYHIYVATKDEFYVDVAWDFARNINDTARVECGYATISDIETHALYDSMDSFWMSETLKYLYLLFTADDETYFINSDPKYKDLLFTTEGHPIPLNIIHRIWNQQMRSNNATKHDFWRRHHWWKLDPFWERFWNQMERQKKFHFIADHKRNLTLIPDSDERYDEGMLLVRNFLKFIGNDKILHEEYRKMQNVVNTDENEEGTQQMVWDIAKLKAFRKNVYDAESGLFYKKQGDDDWVGMGAMRFWDCGRIYEMKKKKGGNNKKGKTEEVIFKLWSLRDCDSFVHSKCWTHRFVDDATCWT